MVFKFGVKWYSFFSFKIASLRDDKGMLDSLLLRISFAFRSWSCPKDIDLALPILISKGWCQGLSKVALLHIMLTRITFWIIHPGLLIGELLETNLRSSLAICKFICEQISVIYLKVLQIMSFKYLMMKTKWNANFIMSWFLKLVN